MPTDLLLAAFALVLIANAVLVAMSIRAMRRVAHADAKDATASVGASAGSGDTVTAEIARADRARRQIRGEPAAAPASERTPAPEPKARARSRTGTTTPGVTDRATAAGPDSWPDRRPVPAGRRSRRKFSLPPLDDDHEKVSRSIESFLTGGDPAGSTTDPTTPTGAPTTVALVAVAATGRSVVGDAPPPDASDWRAAGETARAIVERTLRGAARGSDTVTSDEADRFRIVLAGTGELAARAYLRRIRATVEPLLEASEAPLRLVTATATVLEEPLDGAVEVAGRRLEAAIARLDVVRTTPGQDDDEEDGPEPRASGD